MVENVENVITPFEALIVNCKSHNCKLIRMVSFQILCTELLVADGSPGNPDVGDDKGYEQRYIAHGR